MLANPAPCLRNTQAMDRYQLADSIRLGKEEIGFASEQIDEPDSILEKYEVLEFRFNLNIYFQPRRNSLSITLLQIWHSL